MTARLADIETGGIVQKAARLKGSALYSTGKRAGRTFSPFPIGHYRAPGEHSCGKSVAEILAQLGAPNAP